MFALCYTISGLLWYTASGSCHIREEINTPPILLDAALTWIFTYIVLVGEEREVAVRNRAYALNGYGLLGKSWAYEAIAVTIARPATL